MKRNWKIRLLFALAILASSIYIIYPSIIYFSLSTQKLIKIQKNKNLFKKYIPNWLIQSHIIPGLDLQGGTNVILSIDFTKIIFEKIEEIKEDIKKYAKQYNINIEQIKHIIKKNDINGIKVKCKNITNYKTIQKKIKNKFNKLITIINKNDILLLQLNKQYIQIIKQKIQEQTINIIRNRIDKIGIFEPNIARFGMNKIQIQLPGCNNIEEAKKLIGRTAQLNFQLCNDESNHLTTLINIPNGITLQKHYYKKPNNLLGKDIYLQCKINKKKELQEYLLNNIPQHLTIKYGIDNKSGYLRTYTLQKKVELSGKDLIETKLIPNLNNSHDLNIKIKFTNNGSKIFDTLTKNSIGKRIAIVLENTVSSAPIINQRIPNGNASISITGKYTKNREQEIKELFLVLKSGSLPAPLTFIEEKNIGPSLGMETIQSSKQAFLVGFILITLFMLIYYKLAGVISIIGLFFNSCMLLASLSLLGATITLPGIAGILLTIGMAVDANIIINERIKEELNKSIPLYLAIDKGYNIAFRSIFDANITTLIVGTILWQFGSGPIKNFATMIIIGTITSIISSVFITRIFFDIIPSKKYKLFNL